MTTQVDWTDICAQAQMTISRALVHMKTGLFEARQESPLHCAILERMPIEFVQHNVQGIALVQNSRGILTASKPVYHQLFTGCEQLYCPVASH